MTWLLWLLLASISATGVEYSYRVAAFESFQAAIPYLCIPILFVQLGLFYGFRAAPSLFLASSVFTFMCVIMRVGSSYYIGEHLSVVNWIGVLFLLVSVILLKVK
jgi:hypothetical protein